MHNIYTYIYILYTYVYIDKLQESLVSNIDQLISTMSGILSVPHWLRSQQAAVTSPADRALLVAWGWRAMKISAGSFFFHGTLHTHTHRYIYIYTCYIYIYIHCIVYIYICIDKYWFMILILIFWALLSAILQPFFENSLRILWVRPASVTRFPGSWCR